MRDHLPAWIDTQRLAPGVHLKGNLKLSDREDWPAGETSVSVDIDVVQAPSGRLALQGQLQGQSEVECQRCLQAMQVEWQGEFNLELLASESLLSQVDKELDVLVAEQGRVELHDLVRDESVLALPMMPRHPEGECDPPGAKC